MRKPLAILFSAVLATCWAGSAAARGGHYTFDGGTPVEQRQVEAALDTSSFDWGLVPSEITIHIAPRTDTRAAPGEIWLDAGLVDAGTFAWGLIQHEYAHQVDFFLLDDARHAQLAALGGKAWWSPNGLATAPNGTLAHADLTSERFASTLAWAYWPSTQNAMRPTSVTDESAAMAPAAFRALLGRVLVSQ